MSRRLAQVELPGRWLRLRPLEARLELRRLELADPSAQPAAQPAPRADRLALRAAQLVPLALLLVTRAVRLAARAAQLAPRAARLAAQAALAAALAPLDPQAQLAARAPARAPPAGCAPTSALRVSLRRTRTGRSSPSAAAREG